MTDLSTLDVRSSEAWRAWLKEHHASSPGIWLVFHKGRTARKAMPYEDAVCQALCFGWVDSLIKRLDADRYARKFTPRKHDEAKHGGKHELSSAEKIKVIDTNGDGALSAAEHEAGSRSMFSKMDADHDGRLTLAEIDAGHERMLKRKM